MSSWSNEQREVNRHHGECQSLDSDVQKIHFRDGIRANVWFVWIVFNSSTKGGKKKAHCVGKAVGKKLDQGEQNVLPILQSFIEMLLPQLI
ncbi:uncharacterized protein LOC114308780 isoform X3 [Camellia sinensis]|uniref:uncharacterized protein LOC114308780 isoform X3 n=1 Tax=Camellia sinensis TaxID=4442 RepID=UPI001035D4C4|nr:uncharacterized protein LOC114308780 isoform X3 [Camellia sinensis]